MLTILIRKMLKVFVRKSPIFLYLSIATLLIWFFVLFCVFFWFTDRLLFDFVL